MNPVVADAYQPAIEAADAFGVAMRHWHRAYIARLAEGKPHHAMTIAMRAHRIARNNGFRLRVLGSYWTLYWWEEEA